MWPWPSRSPEAGSRRILCHVANATGSPSPTDRACARPDYRGGPHCTNTLHVPNVSAWTSRQTVPVTLTMGAGTNLLVCSVESSDQGGVNLDYIALA